MANTRITTDLIADGSVTSAKLGVIPNVSVVSTNTTAVKDYAYILTAAITLTLPASPTVGDKIQISNQSGGTPVVARNGSNIQGLAEDLNLNVDGYGIQLIYSGVTKGWVLI